MSRTLSLAASPIRLARTELHLNIEQLAGQASVHVSALYLNECGCYPNVLPKIAGYLSAHGFVERDLQKDYKVFQRSQREEFGRIHDLAGYQLPHPSLSMAPVESLHKSLKLSRMSFAKSICVQPALLFKLVKAEFRHLPTQVESALRDASLEESVIEELNERTEEFYYNRRGKT